MAIDRKGSPPYVSMRDSEDDDLPAIEAPHRQACDGEAEARLVRQLHAAGDETVSLVAVAGTVRHHPLFAEFD